MPNPFDELEALITDLQNQVNELESLNEVIRYEIDLGSIEPGTEYHHTFYFPQSLIVVDIGVKSDYSSANFEDLFIGTFIERENNPSGDGLVDAAAVHILNRSNSNAHHCYLRINCLNINHNNLVVRTAV